MREATPALTNGKPQRTGGFAINIIYLMATKTKLPYQKLAQSLLPRQLDQRCRLNYAINLPLKMENTIAL